MTAGPRQLRDGRSVPAVIQSFGWAAPEGRPLQNVTYLTVDDLDDGSRRVRLWSGLDEVVDVSFPSLRGLPKAPAP